MDSVHKAIDKACELRERVEEALFDWQVAIGNSKAAIAKGKVLLRKPIFKPLIVSRDHELRE